jgi:hypothetical protein
MSALLEVEDKAWPFVISVIPPDPDVAFFRAYFAKQMELLQRKQRWVHVVDVRQIVKLPDAKVRLALAEHTKTIEELSSKYNAGTATIIKSSLVRGILTAIHWIRPPPHPFSNVATPREAVEYLRGCLVNEGLHVPPRMSAEFVETVVARVCREPVGRTAARS